MNTVKLDSSVSLSGLCTGTIASPSSNCPVLLRRSVAYNSTGTTTLLNQLIDQGSNTITLAANTTLAIDLTTGSINPLNETIVSPVAFAKVRYVFLEHDAASLSSGVTIFGNGTNQFQGPLSALAYVTMRPGERQLFEAPTLAGWTVDATHKTIQVVNTSLINPAILRLVVGGSTS